MVDEYDRLKVSLVSTRRFSAGYEVNDLQSVYIVYYCKLESNDQFYAFNFSSKGKLNAKTMTKK